MSSQRADDISRDVLVQTEAMAETSRLALGSQ